ncbi:hypothetical protein [Anaerococcus nagyae]|uniref:hypothetical protein n=1 Tax=Anaerococcus nagyae TaxID=1755241 RepID=UPI00324C0B65
MSENLIMAKLLVGQLRENDDFIENAELFNILPEDVVVDCYKRFKKSIDEFEPGEIKMGDIVAFAIMSLQIEMRDIKIEK